MTARNSMSFQDSVLQAWPVSSATEFGNTRPKVTVKCTRSFVVPSAANIMGQTLELGKWGKNWQ